MAPREVSAIRNSDDSVTVRWNNLTLTEARGWIVHYNIYYWVTGQRTQAVRTKGVQTSRTFTSEDLDVFQTYSIVVTGSTGAGEGEGSEVFVLIGKPRPLSAGIYVYLYY